jgi:4-amino-4-deoxy-L-arabinose transferase-like glycosyltransferase
LSNSQFLPRSQTPVGNALPANSVSRAGVPRETEFREQAFPNGVWERGERADIHFSILYPPFSILYPPSSILYPLCSAALLLVLCWFLFFYRLGDRDLWSSHEGRAAQDAQTILSDHQWGLPRLFDGRIELQKPPLYYWLVAGFAALRGGVVDAWSVRLPAAGAALGSVLVLFGLGLWRGRALAGGIAAAMLATALHYTWLARIGRIDMPLTFVIMVALVGFYLGEQCRCSQNRWSAWGWFFLAYTATAIAALLKGPIGVILPAVVAGSCLWLQGELPGPQQARRWLRLVHELGLWWGLPLLLSSAVPWYLWADIKTNGKLFEVFFWKHNFERGFGGGSLTAHPWWFYGPRLAFDLLPWSLLLPAAAWLLIQRGWRHGDAEGKFGLTWLVAMTLLLSCFRFKRADYLLPAYPGAALFLGSIAERYYREAKRRAVFATGFSLSLGGLALGWWIYVSYLLPGQEPRLEFRHFAEEIRRRAPPPELVIFFRTEAHALAFHVGRPIDTILEWENLDVWCSRPGTYYVVMPPENADEWPRYLKLGRLEEVLRSSDLADGRHAHPLVLLRTRPGIRNQGPGIRAQESGLRSQGSGIRTQEVTDQ